jgi:hypothetical protein
LRSQQGSAVLLVAFEVIIDGEADDILICASKIVLRDGSYGTGEIWHKELVLEAEAGNPFEGKSRRHVAPQALPSSMMESPPVQKPVDETGDAAETDN